MGGCRKEELLLEEKEVHEAAEKLPLAPCEPPCSVSFRLPSLASVSSSLGG